MDKDLRLRKLSGLIDTYGGQAKLADRVDVSAGFISQIVTGRRPFTEKSARKFEKQLNLQNGWFDVGDASHIVPIKKIDDYITIQQYTDVRGAMGKGAYLLETEGEVIDWRVSPEWANNQLPANTGIENLRIITGLGDSMKGLYNSGDPLIVDTGIKSVDFDAVYFFRVGDEGYVKRLQKTPGGILVISQNTDYRDWAISPEMDLEVFGRVLKVWEGKDL